MLIVVVGCSAGDAAEIFAAAAEQGSGRSGTVDGSLGVTVAAETRKAALTAARTAIAAVLEVDPESFDVEA